LAVEGGAVDAGFPGPGLDVAVPAGWDLAAQQAVHDGSYAVLVLGPGGRGDPHVLSLLAVGDGAVSISVMTRSALS
jgi:hypothetical protein